MYFFVSPLTVRLSGRGYLGRYGVDAVRRAGQGQQRMMTKAQLSTTSGSANGPIGFIGLGVMGLPMAANLVEKHGADLVVWNRTRSRCDELASLVRAGAVRTVSEPADVVAACDVTFSMLSTPDASRAVLHDGPGAALGALRPGTGFVDCSTLTVADMEKNEAAAKARGAAFLEAPVSGSKGPAEQGTLLFLCGGDRTLFDSVEGPLSVMGKRSHFLGDVGAGTRMKLVVNSIMGAMLAALAEGVALTEATGLDVDDLLEVLAGGAMANPMFKLKGPNMDARKKKYDTNFPLEHALKDMHFAQRLGDEKGVQMPVAASATSLYERAKDMGLGREDFAAVMESVRAMVNNHQCK